MYKPCILPLECSHLSTMVGSGGHLSQLSLLWEGGKAPPIHIIQLNNYKLCIHVTTLIQLLISDFPIPPPSHYLRGGGGGGGGAKDQSQKKLCHISNHHHLFPLPLQDNLVPHSCLFFVLSKDLLNVSEGTFS